MGKQEHGHIVSLMPAIQGDQLAVAAATGATSLVVGDVADFDEGGGFLQVAGVTYGYSTVDDDTSTIYLTSGLSAGAAVDDPVVVWDDELDSVVTEYVALVMLDYMTSGDPLEAAVAHELIDLLTEDTRAAAGESVTVEWGDDDDLTVVAVHGKAPVNKAIVAAVDPIDVELTQLQGDLAANNADLAAIQGLFPITSTSISDGAISTPKLAANSVTADKIVANSIGADKIIANSISGDKIVANSITGDKINVDTLTARSLSTVTSGVGILTEAGAGSSGTINFLAGSSIPGELTTGTNYLSIESARTSGTQHTAWLQLSTGSSSDISLSADSVSTSNNFTASGIVHGGSFYSDGSAGGGLTTASIDNNGRIHRTSSSRRYKDNIETLDADLIDRALGIRLVTFTRKDDESPEPRRYVGGIAEEVADLGLPALVFHDAEGQVEGIHYDGIAAVALAAAQRQQARLDEKDQQIADLTAQLAALADRVAALEGA